MLKGQRVLRGSRARGALALPSTTAGGHANIPRRSLEPVRVVYSTPSWLGTVFLQQAGSGRGNRAILREGLRNERPVSRVKCGRSATCARRGSQLVAVCPRLESTAGRGPLVIGITLRLNGHPRVCDPTRRPARSRGRRRLFGGARRTETRCLQVAASNLIHVHPLLATPPSRLGPPATHQMPMDSPGVRRIASIRSFP